MCRHGRVGFLECDVGQTEFTPCGVVSLTFVTQPLIGKYEPLLVFVCIVYQSVFRSSLHTSTVTGKVCVWVCVITTMANWSCVCLSSCRAFFIGNSSPMQEPDLYICTVNSLMQYFNSLKESVPLIVNTCGWLKGMPPYFIIPTQHTHSYCHHLPTNLLSHIKAPQRPQEACVYIMNTDCVC